MDSDDTSKLPNNVPGKYFTTAECDGCAYCASVAPENFGFDKETNTYYVSRQPEDSEEDELVREAMDDCPLDAIRVNVNGEVREPA
jgi:ferredoxin